MTRGGIAGVLQHVRRIALTETSVTDGQLLDSYVRGREEAAFEALVRRHGPMVLGVCRRILGNGHDAEDAFQTTFLVLVRKATAIRPRERVGNWLHGVAYRTALKARSAAARRRAAEARLPKRDAVPFAPPDDWQTVIDQELGRLPDKYRAAVVLCDLEGKTRKQAARQLGWADGTVCTRLSRAREMLLARLSRRGVTLSAAVLAGSLLQNSAAAGVPPWLVVKTVQAQKTITLTGAAGIPAKAALLMEGVNGMKLMNVKALAALAVVTLMVFGFGLGGYQAVPAEEPATNKGSPLSKSAPVTQPPEKVPVALDPEIVYVSLPEAIAAALEGVTEEDVKGAPYGYGYGQSGPCDDSLPKPIPKPAARVLLDKQRGNRMPGILVVPSSSDVSAAEFQRRLNAVLLQVELAYWKLYQAYGVLYSNEQVLHLGHRAWRLGEASFTAGRTNPQDFYPIRAQYEEFRGERLKSLGIVAEAERNLRGLIGMPVEDGKRLVPVTPPTLTHLQPSWDAALEDALALRPELMLARQNLKNAKETAARQQERAAQQQDQEAQPQVVNLMDQFKDLMKEGKYAEARATALKAKELDADNSAVDAAIALAALKDHQETRLKRRLIAEVFNLLGQQLAMEYKKLDEFSRLLDTASAERRGYDESTRTQWQFYKVSSTKGDNNAQLVLSLLDYQRRLTVARVKEYQAVADYNCTLARFDWARGTIMQRHNVSISDEPPKGVQVRAVVRERKQTRDLVLRAHPQPLTQPGLLAGNGESILQPDN